MYKNDFLKGFGEMELLKNGRGSKMILPNVLYPTIFNKTVYGLLKGLCTFSLMKKYQKIKAVGKFAKFWTLISEKSKLATLRQ